MMPAAAIPAAGSALAREVPGIPSPAEYHDPAWLVRRAWSSYRLAGLQAVIRTTIGELQELSLADVLGADWPAAERLERRPDPILEALRACSEELRDASGMAGSSVARAAHCSLVRRYISQQPPSWGTAFASALDKYRHAACAALLAAFRQRPASS